MKKITIRDIAQMAGVSIGTVDRVLHNRGEVSEKTKEKILKITRTINYQPDIFASTLASKKNLKFSVILPAPETETTFWKIPNIGIEKAMHEIVHYGISCSKYLYSISDKDSFIAQADKLIAENPDGLVIAASFQSEASDLAKICDERQIPYVFFNSTTKKNNPICFVGQDARQSGFVAAKLMDLGSQKGDKIIVISILSLLKNNNHIFERKQGFCQYFEHNKNKKIDIICIDLNTMNIVEVYEKLRKIFNQHANIKGIFVTNSRVFQIANFLETENLQNIKLIGYDLTAENIPYLEKNHIHFLINQKPIEQAYRAIMVLFSKIVLKKEVPGEILLPIDIVTRENLIYYEEY